MKKAIVLSGGGAYGSYQIGVWKALRELNIKYDIVTGTSVGSMNAAWMVQGDYRKAKSMWERISFSSLFEAELENNIDTSAGKREVLKIFAKNLVSKGGMQQDKLEAIIKKSLKISKFYKSKIDFGLVTVKLPSFKPVMLTKSDIKPSELIDFIGASASIFPAYKVKEIANESYIDGGYREHLPLELAIKMGAKEIIAVDVMNKSKAEVKKEKNAKIMYISPNNDLGTFFGFSKKQAVYNMRLGYNDTMKAFGKLEGAKYTFKHGHLEKNLNKYEKGYKTNIENIFNLNKKSNVLKEELFKKTDYYKMLNNDKYFEKTIYSAVEYLGKTFKLNPADIYSTSRYNNYLMYELEKINIKRLTTIEKKIETRDVSNIFSSKVIIKYMYEKLEDLGRSKKKRKDLSKLALFLPKEFMSALYLYTVFQKKKLF